MARRRHRRRRSNAPRRRRRHSAVRSHRRRRSNPRGIRRHRGRRRNPGGFRLGGGRGIVGKVMTGVVDAAWVLGGEAGTNIIAGFVPVTGTALQAAVKVAAAVAVSWVAGRVNSNAAKMALAGGLASVIRGPVKAANLPLISANLGDGDLYSPGQYAVGAYPMAPALSAYPTAGYSGDEDESFVSSGQ